MSWANVVTPLVTLVGGAGFAEAMRAIRTRGRGEAENARDLAAADSYIVDAATKLLAPYREEVAGLRAEVEALKAEMQSDRHEQARVTGLLQQSIAVIKDFLDIARTHRWAAPEMSAELLAEIERQK